MKIVKKERSNHFYHIIKKRYLNIYQEIIKRTNYLSEDCKFTERIYQIINDLKERPKMLLRQ